jgi:hypothetical protein
MGNERQFYECRGGQNRDEKSHGSLPQGNRAAVFTKCPCDRQQCKYAEQRLQLKHNSPEAGGDYGSDREGCKSDNSSCPGMTRASTPFFERQNKTWMAGSSPGMTKSYPRPTNGILLAMTVMNSTLASSGRLAI